MPFVKGDPNINREGRPKGKTLKEFARNYYMLKTDEEKVAYIKNLEDKKPGFPWEMAEGRPKQDVDVDGEITTKIISIDE
jgi:hypothetical protein